MLERSDILDLITTGRVIEDVWVLTHYELPATVNQERTWHYHKRAKVVKGWREAGFWLSKEAQVPKMQEAHIHSICMLQRMNRDVASELTSMKSLLDGAITDSGVMPDDRPPHVQSLTFHAPIKSTQNALVMVIEKIR